LVRSRSHKIQRRICEVRASSERSTANQPAALRTHCARVAPYWSSEVVGIQRSFVSRVVRAAQHLRGGTCRRNLRPRLLLLRSGGGCPTHDRYPLCWSGWKVRPKSDIVNVVTCGPTPIPTLPGRTHSSIDSDFDRGCPAEAVGPRGCRRPSIDTKNIWRERPNADRTWMIRATCFNWLPRVSSMEHRRQRCSLRQRGVARVWLSCTAFDVVVLAD